MPNSVSRSSGYSNSKFSGQNSLSQSCEYPEDWKLDCSLLKSQGNSHDLVRSNDSDVETWLVERIYSSPDVVRLACNFTADEDPEKPEQLLDNVRPHNMVTELTIQSYTGSKFPDSWWSGDPSSSLTRLASVSLIDCHGIQDCLPPSLGLLPCLRSLTVKYSHVRDFCIRTGTDKIPRYLSLSMLTLIDMVYWEAWSGFKDSDFPKLGWLEFTRCHRLKEIPHFSALHVLTLNSCHNLTTIPSFPSLADLNVDDCDGLVKVSHPLDMDIDVDNNSEENPPHIDINVAFYSSLTSLVLTNCNRLTEFPSFRFLSSLRITSCRSLTIVPSLQSLTHLSLTDCNGLVNLPHTPSLQNLSVARCGKLKSIDFLLPNCSTPAAWLNRILSLNVLSVINCPRLCSPLVNRKLPFSFDKRRLEAWFLKDVGVWSF